MFTGVLGEWVPLKGQAVGTAETTIAHSQAVAPTIVLLCAVNAAAHYAGQTKAADATNIYVIADSAVNFDILMWFPNGTKRTS